jgi:hypothetical protein
MWIKVLARRRMDKRQNHCCDEMSAHLDAGELYFSYIPKFREYGIHYREEFGGGRQVVRHCPWCGKKLPPPNREAWFDEIDKLGLDPDGDLPKQFLTDEWWRLRKND